ncbi:MAG: 30S ribosomal protein S19e [Nanoarchaeota archaeon]
MTVYDVNATQLIHKTAESLKPTLQMPVWAAYVKTGHGKERVPDHPDWWYVRAAAILRKVYLNSPIGTNQLSVLFGNKKNRGMKPELTVPGSRKIIRTILQQLETAGYIQQASKGVHKGRVITGKGKSFLDKISTSLKA